MSEDCIELKKPVLLIGIGKTGKKIILNLKNEIDYEIYQIRYYAHSFTLCLLK